MTVDYFAKYGVERPRTNDVRPLGPLAAHVAEIVLETYRKAEIERLERRARTGPDDRDIIAQYANWALWVRVGHLLQVDPGPFAPL